LGFEIKKNNETIFTDKVGQAGVIDANGNAISKKQSICIE
jgi:hypothetical protein